MVGWGVGRGEWGGGCIVIEVFSIPLLASFKQGQFVIVRTCSLHLGELDLLLLKI